SLMRSGPPAWHAPITCDRRRARLLAIVLCLCALTRHAIDLGAPPLAPPHRASLDTLPSATGARLSHHLALRIVLFTALTCMGPRYWRTSRVYSCGPPMRG